MSYAARLTMAKTPTQAELDRRDEARRSALWIVGWTFGICLFLTLIYYAWSTPWPVPALKNTTAPATSISTGGISAGSATETSQRRSAR